MSIVTGLLIFNSNRSGEFDPTSDSGIVNIPIVLQNIDTLESLATLTNDNGEYKFDNVPPGNYRVVVADVYSGNIILSAADFENNAQIQPNIQEAKLPSYEVIAPQNRVDGMNALNTITPTTVNVFVEPRETLTASFFVGPAKYKPVKLDPSINPSQDNLINTANDGTFGTVPQGSPPNIGLAQNPYLDVNSDFTFIQQSNEIPQGYYSIGSTTSPYNNTYNWWRLSGHTTGLETDRMQIINGDGVAKPFFTTNLNNLQKNTTYFLSLWVANIDKSSNNSKIGILVNGLNNKDILYNNLSDEIETNTQLPVWQQVGIVFNIGDNTSVSLNFLNNNSTAYAIDDIKLQQVILSGLRPQKIVAPSCATIGDIVTYTIKLFNTSQNTLRLS